MAGRIQYGSLAWNLLKAVGYGAITASLLVAPNIGVALAPLLRDDPRARREWRRRHVQQAMKRLRDRRLVRYEERGKETYLMITEHGKQRLRTFEFEQIRLPDRPRRWDGKWRIVAFDIPERKRRERKIFRDKLDQLGFLALQRSVYVYPYPCGDEIDFLSHFLAIHRFAHLIEAGSLGSAEGFCRRRFDLL